MNHHRRQTITEVCLAMNPHHNYHRQNWQTSVTRSVPPTEFPPFSTDILCANGRGVCQKVLIFEHFVQKILHFYRKTVHFVREILHLVQKIVDLYGKFPYFVQGIVNFVQNNRRFFCKNRKFCTDKREFCIENRSFCTEIVNFIPTPHPCSPTGRAPLHSSVKNEYPVIPLGKKLQSRQ